MTDRSVSRIRLKYAKNASALRRGGVLLAVSAFLLGGCEASLTRDLQLGGAVEGVVEEMARSRWDALVGGDYEKAYGMLSPGSRSLLRKEDFVSKSGKVAWMSADVLRVECSGGDVCNVNVRAKYSYTGRRIGKVESYQYVSEVWRRVDGEWWIVIGGM